MSDRSLRVLVVLVAVALAAVVVLIGLALTGDDGTDDVVGSTVVLDPGSGGSTTVATDPTESTDPATEDDDSEVTVVTLEDRALVEAWRGRIDIGPGEGQGTPTDPPFSMVVAEDGRFGSQPALTFMGGAEPGLSGCRDHTRSPLDWPPVGLLSPLVGQYACATVGPVPPIVVQAHLLEVGEDDTVTFDVIVWTRN